MPDIRKKVFISYNTQDRSVANQIRNALIHENATVWLDALDVQPGDNIATSIDEGIRGSDYFLLIISESSNRSPWVQREIATAFELSNRKMISVIPFLIADVDVPFEMRGLLYIDARRSLQDGIHKLVEFFRRQISPVMVLQRQVIIRKSIDPLNECRNKLQRLLLGDLRYHLAQRLGLSDIKVLWFDVFHRKMEDEVQVQNIGLSTVELVDRCVREDLLASLIEKICRNHPRFSPLL